MNDLDEQFKAGLLKRSERALGCKIKKIIMVASILHRGWEMDHYIWAVETESGQLIALTTDLGGVVEIEFNELNGYIQSTKLSLESLISLQRIMSKL